MIQQDQLSPCSSSEAPPEDLIHSLLQEDPHVPGPSHDDRPIQVREQMLAQRIYLGKDDHRMFELDLLDKEDSNCLFPQKLELDPPEEEPVLAGTIVSWTTASPPPSVKRQSKISRSVYLEESRATKLARYRQKKKRRIWDRKIFYDCRKKVADNRQRINGRFVKKSPLMPGMDAANTQKTSAASNDLELIQDLQLDGIQLLDFQL